MDNQRKVENNQKHMSDNYQRYVQDPQIQRIQMEKEREAKDYAEVKTRFDKEKDYVHAQKNQAKKLNYMQLQMQREEQDFITKMNDTNTFNKN